MKHPIGAVPRRHRVRAAADLRDRPDRPRALQPRDRRRVPRHRAVFPRRPARPVGALAARASVPAQPSSSMRSPHLDSQPKETAVRVTKRDLDAHAGRRRGGDARSPASRGRSRAAGEDRPAGHAGRAVRGRRRRRHARRRAGGEAAQRHGRRPQDRDHQGVVRRQARRRGQRDAQAGRAGQGRHHGRPAVGRRRHRGQGLREDAAEHHLHQRRLGRAGDDAGQPGAELLPLQHRRRAVDGGPGQGRARQGLQADDGDRRGLRVPVLAGAGLHVRVLPRSAARCR